MSFDLLIERDFLDAATCARVVAEMREARSAPATVYGRADSGAGGAVDERMRRTTRVYPSAETEALVRRLLLERVGAVESHFGVRPGELEEAQFLRYEAGGYFVAHQDGNTGLLRSERESRRVSVVVFLNTQSDSPGAPAAGAYCGGSLVFHPRGAGKPLSLAGEAGTLVAFRAETTHEVTPVTDGERFTIACWYR